MAKTPLHGPMVALVLEAKRDAPDGFARGHGLTRLDDQPRTPVLERYERAATRPVVQLDQGQERGEEAAVGRRPDDRDAQRGPTARAVAPCELECGCIGAGTQPARVRQGAVVARKSQTHR